MGYYSDGGSKDGSDPHVKGKDDSAPHVEQVCDRLDRSSIDPQGS